jgi:hypothetical protein
MTDTTRVDLELWHESVSEERVYDGDEMTLPVHAVFVSRCRVSAVYLSVHRDAVQRWAEAARQRWGGRVVISDLWAVRMVWGCVALFGDNDRLTSK